MSDWILLSAFISNESRSGRAAAISSALTSGFSLTYSVGGKAKGAGSNFGKSTSILNYKDSSLGLIPCCA